MFSCRDGPSHRPVDIGAVQRSAHSAVADCTDSSKCGDFSALSRRELADAERGQSGSVVSGIFRAKGGLGSGGVAGERLQQCSRAGDLHVGARESTAAVRSLAIMPRRYALHTEVRIAIKTDVAQNLSQHLLHHEIEVALNSEPVMFAQLLTLSVFDVSQILIVPRSFPQLDSPKEDQRTDDHRVRNWLRLSAPYPELAY